MQLEELLKHLDDFTDKKHDFGPCLFMWSSYIELYGDGSGVLVLELHRNDGVTKKEILCNLVGADRVEKRIGFDNVTELIEILHRDKFLTSELK